MPPLANIFDSYDRRARFYPMALVLLPVALGVAAWVPAGFDIPAFAGSTVAALAVASFLTQIARDEGKKREPYLFRMWGGKPSVRALSYGANVFPTATIARYHRKLAELDPQLAFPRSREEEQDDPNGAASVYESANDMLLHRTRDKQQFNLLFQENMNYGYRRNLWGMKAAGLLTSTLGLLSGLANLIQTVLADAAVTLTPVAAIGTGLLLLVLWTARVTPAWVKLAADSYARQLVAATEAL